MSEMLIKAQEKLNSWQGHVNTEYKPKYHLSVPAGWLNDPNGFGFFQGKCHLFYQYHPYDTVWGPMHWGHWTSENLIDWEQEPVAMAPDREYDTAGCFSGTAIEDDGRYWMTIPMICGICGKRYRRKITRRGTAYAAPVWICSTYNYRGKAYCASKQIPEAILLEMITVALGNRHTEDEVDHLKVHPNNRILFVFQDGHVEEHIWKDHSRKGSWNTDKRKKAAEKTRAQHQRRRECEAQ